RRLRAAPTGRRAGRRPGDRARGRPHPARGARDGRPACWQLGSRGRCLSERPGGERLMRYWVQLATEQFPPSELVDQAVEAERAGFDAVNVSDHLQPWWEPGHSGQAWALLGAIGQATERVEI